MEGGRLEEARQAFGDAAAIEPLLPQALYNMGVVNLRLQEPESALVPLRKLHTLLPDQPEVVHCIALAHDMLGDTQGAIRWLELLTSLVPNDPGVLLGEEARSLAYYQDAHRVWPVNLDVISWLGAYHVRTEVYERAVPYFELAAAIQPSEVKWALMVASCHRRVGAYEAALAKYESIAASHPGNTECLRYLGRKVAAQAQEEQEVCISARESFELVRCLLRVSIYHVSFLRGLFPDKMFSGATMNNLGGVTVQMLGGDGVQLSQDAQKLKDWVEKGVVEAVKERFLKKLYFGIAADPECTDILEEFVFTFAYGADGGGTTMNLDASATAAGGKAHATFKGGKAGAGSKLISIKHVKNQIYRLMRTLVELCSTLDEVPEQRHIFMRLTYQEDAPADYEPPHFAPATEQQANGAFAAQPFSMKAGSLATEHHRVSVRVKSLLDAVDDAACAPGDDEEEMVAMGLAANGADADAGGGAADVAAAAQHQQRRGAAAAGGGGADFKGDEGDEGGGAVGWGEGRGDGVQAGDQDMAIEPRQTALNPGAAAHRGIRREEATPPPEGEGGGGLLGPSQEVDGPVNTDRMLHDANQNASPASGLNDDLGVGHPDQLGYPPDHPGNEDAAMGDAHPADQPARHVGSQALHDTQVPANEEELLQLTLAPPPLDAAMEDLQLAGSGPQAPAAPSSVAHHMGGSQTSSQAAAAATERVPMQALESVFACLVADNLLQQVTADDYARAAAGDSDDAPGGGKRRGGRTGNGGRRA
ncbi:putative Intraflagellar transport protein [Monoraphidium neglectum]|uniref:Putative Intraflagellar transport protein n=1 Tax=Monoraphidium neglectum TaxID=145388 RepID=A0A0D2MPX7_9CHLO|nr:putative Intraflagellar transport protein [Monoraphidium neglectum]KIZ02527.1 putative Intraflagellar transport protein [Monoraphidium neglectum]|eukprot:XP_013901546.1 putative Intraflagellar transport protein [Monoraphidium neglectum]